MKKSIAKKSVSILKNDYSQLLGDVTQLLDSARRQSARVGNAILTATYWDIGRRIVEFEQHGKGKADYGKQIIEQLSLDLSARFDRGFGRRNIFQMRLFYLAWDPERIRRTLSGKSEKVQTVSAQSRSSSARKVQTVSAQFTLHELTHALPLPWSHYVQLLSVESEDAREFYEGEALRSGWSVRQLDRQISTQFYERTLLSKNKAAMLRKGSKTRTGESPTAEDEIKDPFVLEFLGLKDEYSESDLEEALIAHLNYAREHWMNKNENPPVGLILCTEKDTAVAKYALEGLSNKVLAAEYKLALPDEVTLVKELKQTQKMIEARRGKR